MRPDVRLASRLGPPGSAADDAANGGRGAIELRAKASYLDVIDALFVQHATASGYTTFIGSSWTSGCDPVEAGFDA